MITPSTVELQGDVLRLTVTYADTPYSPKSRRGKITSFSRKSRLRLLEFLARTGDSKLPRVFLTLTYPSNMTDTVLGKRHLQTFLKRVKRKYPQASAIWRMEFQKRGAVHFHLLFFRLPYWEAQDIRRSWGECIGEPNPRIQIKTCRSRRESTYYVAKYMAKVASAASVSLSNLPYLTAGRQWGYFNHDAIPMAEQVIFEVLANIGAFWDLKRAMRRYNPKYRKSGGGGSMIFVQDAIQWERYWEMLAST